jgi:hypothetical protein
VKIARLWLRPASNKDLARVWFRKYLAAGEPVGQVGTLR